MIDAIISFLEKKSILVNIIIYIFLFILIVITALLDFYIENINFFIFFSFSVVIASFVFGLKEGMFAAILCSIASLIINMKYLYNSEKFYYLLNFMIDILFYAVIIFIVAQLRVSLIRERNLSRTDFLTGASNKRYFSEMMCSEISRSSRNKKTFSLAFIDMDNFKKINDTYGHSIGDIVLIAFVRILKENTRRNDIIGRLGGDEFVILFPETDLKSGKKTLERISDFFLEEMQKSNYPVSLSAGLAVFKNIPETIDIAYKNADLLMYLAKNGGKNRIEVKEF